MHSLLRRSCTSRHTEDELVEALVQKIRDITTLLTSHRASRTNGEGGTKSETSIIDEKEFFEKAPEVARLAIEDACTLSNPRKPTQEEMEQLLKCVYFDLPVEF